MDSLTQSIHQKNNKKKKNSLYKLATGQVETLGKKTVNVYQYIAITWQITLLFLFLNVRTLLSLHTVGA